MTHVNSLSPDAEVEKSSSSSSAVSTFASGGDRMLLQGGLSGRVNASKLPLSLNYAQAPAQSTPLAEGDVSGWFPSESEALSVGRDTPAAQQLAARYAGSAPPGSSPGGTGGSYLAASTAWLAPTARAASSGPLDDAARNQEEEAGISAQTRWWRGADRSSVSNASVDSPVRMSPAGVEDRDVSSNGGSSRGSSLLGAAAGSTSSTGTGDSSGRGGALRSTSLAAQEGAERAAAEQAALQWQLSRLEQHRTFQADPHGPGPSLPHYVIGFAPDAAALPFASAAPWLLPWPYAGAAVPLAAADLAGGPLAQWPWQPQHQQLSFAVQQQQQQQQHADAHSGPQHQRRGVPPHRGRGARGSFPSSEDLSAAGAPPPPPPLEPMFSEDHRVLRVERAADGREAFVWVTLLAAGFVIGSAGAAARQIGQVTGALVQSWTEVAGLEVAGMEGEEIRRFRIQGRREKVERVICLIHDAVQRYKELCERKREGQFVLREHRIDGVDFQYQPPPRKALQQQGQQAGTGGHRGAAGSAHSSHGSSSSAGRSQHLQHGVRRHPASASAPPPSSSVSQLLATAVPFSPSASPLPPAPGVGLWPPSHADLSPATWPPLQDRLCRHPGGLEALTAPPASPPLRAQPPQSRSGGHEAPGVRLEGLLQFAEEGHSAAADAPPGGAPIRSALPAHPNWVWPPAATSRGGSAAVGAGWLYGMQETAGVPRAGSNGSRGCAGAPGTGGPLPSPLLGHGVGEARSYSDLAAMLLGQGGGAPTGDPVGAVQPYQWKEGGALQGPAVGAAGPTPPAKQAPAPGRQLGVEAEEEEEALRLSRDLVARLEALQMEEEHPGEQQHHRRQQQQQLREEQEEEAARLGLPFSLPSAPEQLGRQQGSAPGSAGGLPAALPSGSPSHTQHWGPAPRPLSAALLVSEGRPPPSAGGASAAAGSMPNALSPPPMLACLQCGMQPMACHVASCLHQVVCQACARAAPCCPLCGAASFLAGLSAAAEARRQQRAAEGGRP